MDVPPLPAIFRCFCFLVKRPENFLIDCHDISFRRSWFPDDYSTWLWWIADFSFSDTSRFKFQFFCFELSQNLQDWLAQVLAQPSVVPRGWILIVLGGHWLFIHCHSRSKFSFLHVKYLSIYKIDCHKFCSHSWNWEIHSLFQDNGS